MDLDSQFSYRCNGCHECCRRHLIQVNPYEVIQISAHLGISTGTVIAQYLQVQRPWLKQRASGDCVFLDDRGCTIHASRPLVCRVYPTGMRYDSDYRQAFRLAQRPKDSTGVLGAQGTLRQYLDSQGWQPFDAATRQCDALRLRLIELAQSGRASSIPEGVGDDPMDWLDADKLIRLGGEVPSAEAADARFVQYLRIVGSWIDPD